MHHQYVQYRLETVTSAVVLDLRCAGNKVLKPVGRHVSTVHVGWLPRQVIKTVHPMCCVPSSVDTLSGLLGYHALFPLMKFVFLIFSPLLSRAQHNDRASLYAALQIYLGTLSSCVLQYKQGPSLTSRAPAHDLLTSPSPPAPSRKKGPL